MRVGVVDGEKIELFLGGSPALLRGRIAPFFEGSAAVPELHYALTLSRLIGKSREIIIMKEKSLRVTYGFKERLRVENEKEKIDKLDTAFAEAGPARDHNAIITPFLEVINHYLKIIRKLLIDRVISKDHLFLVYRRL